MTKIRNVLSNTNYFKNISTDNIDVVISNVVQEIDTIFEDAPILKIYLSNTSLLNFFQLFSEIFNSEGMSVINIRNMLPADLIRVKKLIFKIHYFFQLEFVNLINFNINTDQFQDTILESVLTIFSQLIITLKSIINNLGELAYLFENTLFKKLIDSQVISFSDTEVEALSANISILTTEIQTLISTVAEYQTELEKEVY
jgi:hypothetical protein